VVMFNLKCVTMSKIKAKYKLTFRVRHLNSVFVPTVRSISATAL